MNRTATESAKEGQVLVLLAGLAMVLPEFLGPYLLPELGGIEWLRLGLTILLAVGVIARVRWIRWVTVGLVVLGLVMGLAGSAILSPPARRIPYLISLAVLDGFVLYVLVLSDRASQYFEARSKPSSFKIGDGAV